MVDVIETYECGKCGEEYYNWRDADHCCSDNNTKANSEERE